MEKKILTWLKWHNKKDETVKNCFPPEKENWFSQGRFGEATFGTKFSHTNIHFFNFLIF
jgi:hypothetical protein